MPKQTAIVIGATGLVGQQLIKRLAVDEAFSEIKTFTRRPLPNTLNHDKIQQNIVDFDDIDAWADLITGDILFCCIGTTLKKAGSKAKQTVIDLDYPTLIANKAKQNSVEQALLLSSIGANSAKGSFYLQLKSQLEANFKDCKFERLSILRPSVLVGDRDEFRLGEKLGIAFLSVCWPLPYLRKYRPIEGTQVAKALVHFAKYQPAGVLTLENPELFI